jgi:hypothetical protein
MYLKIEKFTKLFIETRKPIARLITKIHQETAKQLEEEINK